MPICKAPDSRLLDSTGTEFHDADATGASFKKSEGTGVGFAGATLSGASFSEATLTSSDFSGAIMSGTGFQAATLNGSDFGYIKDRDFRIVGATVVGVKVDESSPGLERFSEEQKRQLILTGRRSDPSEEEAVRPEVDVPWTKIH